jgi:F-type H+-transporting ATPase subunit b
MITPESQQPGILSPDVTLVILTWISFLGLLVVLHKFAWKPILAGLKQREDYIRKSLEDADKLNKQLAEAEAAKGKILDEAKEKANAIIEQSRKMGSELATQIEGRAKKSAEEIISSAHQEIEGECERARKELRKESAQTAVSLAEKILKENLDAKKNRDLINQALKDI